MKLFYVYVSHKDKVKNSKYINIIRSQGLWCKKKRCGYKIQDVKKKKFSNGKVELRMPI